MEKYWGIEEFMEKKMGIEELMEKNLWEVRKNGKKNGNRGIHGKKPGN